MKKIVMLIMFALMANTMVMAQSSMSDAQIIEFIQKEQKAGTSQSQIVVKLMQKGVSAQKLQEVRRKYEKLGGQSTQGAKDVTSGTSRNRVGGAEGAGVKSVRKMPTGQNQIKEPNLQNYSDEKDAEYIALKTEVDDFMPDSTGMFNRELLALSRSQRRVFGRDIFNNENLSFEPNMNIATPDDYVLGPGDQVFIDVYGASQKSVEATVTPDGDVNIEGFGPVQVSGLTVKKANQRLRSQLGQRYAGSNIRLTVGATRTIMVNVMGEVQMPGTYTLSAFASVFHALYMAGGVSDIGTLRDIKVYRKNKLVSSVDIYDYILNGKLTGNVKLADNDVIVVGPYDCLVNIAGKVKRPMFYEMKKGESLETLMKYSGGFTGDAYTGSVRVLRKAGKQYSVFNVTEFEMKEFTLCDEDSVGVEEVVKRYENVVELRGAAMRPGMYQLGKGITTVRDLLNVANGINEEAMLDHVILHRKKADRSLEVLSFNLARIMDGAEADVTLQSEDVVFIPSRSEQNKEQALQIFGEVFYPGKYVYAEGTTVEDLVLQAGGLKDGANVEHVTVNRRVAASAENLAVAEKKSKGEDTRVSRVQTFDITLKDNFTLDGGDGFKLQPFDEVYVGKVPGYSEQVRITVDGEAMFRGTYALKTDNARLSDVVAQAGGVTNGAWVKGAYVLRKMTEEEMQRREQQMADLRVYHAEVVSSTNANVDRTRRELVDSLLWTKYAEVEEYKVGIELDKALKKPGCEYDITLRDGDKLVIPQYDAVIRMSGEVNLPGSTTFVEGKTAQYYINQAGGVTGSGWKSHAYVAYPNGNVRKVGTGAKIEPGCEVIVPTKPIRTNSNASLWISAISSLGTVLALVVTALRK